MGQYDIALRHVVQQQITALAAGIAPDFPVESASWLETQLTALERRSDKALELRGAGQRRLLHVEFLVDPRSDLDFDMFEYSSMLVISLYTEAKAQAGGKLAAIEIPPIKSVAIVLSGRARPWPRTGQYRTSWPESGAFTGHQFQIEPVYQRTVEELMARPGAFWLVFTPLATNANVDFMRRVIEEIRCREPGQKERGELYTALLVMAELDPWGHGLRKEIEMLVQEMDLESIMASETLRNAYQDGEAKGLLKGVEQCKEVMLRTLLARRLHRELTPEEQGLLSTRLPTLDPEHAASVVLDLSADALLAWLHGPDAE